MSIDWSHVPANLLTVTGPICLLLVKQYFSARAKRKEEAADIKADLDEKHEQNQLAMRRLVVVSKFHRFHTHTEPPGAVLTRDGMQFPPDDFFPC